MFQKIPFHRQLADLGVQLLDPPRIGLRFRWRSTALEDIRRTIEQCLLPLMDHRRVNTEPACQLGHRLLTLQRFQRNPRLELGFVNLAFRYN